MKMRSPSYTGRQTDDGSKALSEINMIWDRLLTPRVQMQLITVFAAYVL